MLRCGGHFNLEAMSTRSTCKMRHDATIARMDLQTKQKCNVYSCLVFNTYAKSIVNMISWKQIVTWEKCSSLQLGRIHYDTQMCCVHRDQGQKVCGWCLLIVYLLCAFVIWVDFLERPGPIAKTKLPTVHGQWNPPVPNLCRHSSFRCRVQDFLERQKCSETPLTVWFDLEQTPHTVW